MKRPFSFRHEIFFLGVLVFISFVMFARWIFHTHGVGGGVGTSTCSGVVISLATFGARMFKLEPIIRSLIDQSIKVDMIVVHVALVSRSGTIPRAVAIHYFQKTFDSCFQSSDAHHGGVQCSNNLLFLFGTDMGPATKVLGTITTFPHLDKKTCIVSVDDDVVYDKNVVSALVLNAPSDGGALGLNCEEIPSQLNFVRFFIPSALWWHTITSDNGWQFPYENIVQCKGWLQGYQGALYRRGSFGDDVFSMAETMPDGCYYADDVRLSGYLWTKGIKRYVFPHFVRDDGCKSCGHLEKNASDALSLVQNTMSLKQWPCAQYFGWD